MLTRKQLKKQSNDLKIDIHFSHLNEIAMQELVCVVVLREKFRLLMEGAALFGIGLESVIENTLYSGVSSRRGFIPRVQISGNGPPRGYVDECAVLVPAQHN